MTNSSGNCDLIRPLLDAYHDCELDQIDKQVVEQHLSICPQCQKNLADVGKIVATLRSLPEVVPKVDLCDRIERMIIENEKSTQTKVTPFLKPSRSTGTSIGLAAALLCLVLSALFIWRSLTVQEAYKDGSNYKVHPAVIAQQPLSDSNLPISTDNANLTETQMSDSFVGHPAANPPIPANAPTHESRSRLSPANKFDQNASFVKLDKFPTDTQTSTHYASNSKEDNEESVADNNQNRSLVAFGEPANISEELGISTDEDGLYAIKM